jgi:cephalosporin hydroxylase
MSEFYTRLKRLGINGYKLEEIDLLVSAIKKFQPDVICEWGTNIGESARVFYEIVETHGIDCEVHSTEYSPNVDTGMFVKRVPVHLHHGLGVEVSIPLVREGGFKRPFFFVDDSHEEEGVFEQLKKIAIEFPQAVIAVHDLTTAKLVGRSVVMVAHEPLIAVQRFLVLYRYDLKFSEKDQTLGILTPC